MPPADPRQISRLEPVPHPRFGDQVPGVRRVGFGFAPQLREIHSQVMGFGLVRRPPPPGVSSTSMPAPTASARPRATASPNPTPEPCGTSPSRWNGANITSRSSAGTPGPWSTTRICTRLLFVGDLAGQQPHPGAVRRVPHRVRGDVGDHPFPRPAAVPRGHRRVGRIAGSHCCDSTRSPGPRPLGRRPARPEPVPPGSAPLALTPRPWRRHWRAASQPQIRSFPLNRPRGPSAPDSARCRPPPARQRSPRR